MRAARRALLTTLLAAVPGAALIAECDRPLVATRVEIDAQRILRKFDPKGRDDVARDAGRALARLGNEIFPFFCWVAAEAANAPVATLVAQVTDGQGDKTGAVVVRYRAETKGGVLKVSGVGMVPESVLYESWKPLADADTRPLLSGLVANLWMLKQKDTPERLEAHFASKVPLGRKVEFGEQSIFILFDEARLRAGRNTELRIEEPKKVFVLVRKTQPCWRRNRFSTEVTAFQANGQQRAGWHSSIPGWLKDSMSRDALEVFLEELVLQNCTGTPSGTAVPPPIVRSSCISCLP